MANVAAVIPARYQSSRFPGKPLADILGESMIARVVESTSSADLIDETYVATDDERIRDEVKTTSATPVMTPTDIDSGSDRVASVASGLDADIIVNVQGDEPLIRGSDLDQGIQVLKDSDCVMASFMVAQPRSELQDPDKVTVVVDERSRALYFSRSTLPYSSETDRSCFLHVGIYLFRREYLLEFASRDPTKLEETEDLEQLRVLEHGDTIKMVEIDEPTIGVDREEDIQEVERVLRERQNE